MIIKIAVVEEEEVAVQKPFSGKMEVVMSFWDTASDFLELFLLSWHDWNCSLNVEASTCNLCKSAASKSQWQGPNIQSKKNQYIGEHFYIFNIWDCWQNRAGLYSLFFFLTFLHLCVCPGNLMHQTVSAVPPFIMCISFQLQNKNCTFARAIIITDQSFKHSKALCGSWAAAWPSTWY